MNGNDQRIRDLVLSPVQADVLLKLCDGLASRDSGRDGGLDDVYERLCDSFSVAQWLRESVHLELRAEESICLIEAVVATLNQREWSDEDCRALRGVIQRLSAASSMPDALDMVVQTPGTASVA